MDGSCFVSTEYSFVVVAESHNPSEITNKWHVFSDISFDKILCMSDFCGLQNDSIDFTLSRDRFQINGKEVEILKSITETYITEHPSVPYKTVAFICIYEIKKDISQVLEKVTMQINGKDMGSVLNIKNYKLTPSICFSKDKYKVTIQFIKVDKETFRIDFHSFINSDKIEKEDFDFFFSKINEFAHESTCMFELIKKEMGF